MVQRGSFMWVEIVMSSTELYFLGPVENNNIFWRMGIGISTKEEVKTVQIWSFQGWTQQASTKISLCCSFWMDNCIYYQFSMWFGQPTLATFFPDNFPLFFWTWSRSPSCQNGHLAIRDLESTPENWTGKSSCKPPFLGSMLIFQGVTV